MDLRSFEIRFELAVPIRFDSKVMGRFENFRIGRVCPLLVVVNKSNGSLVCFAMNLSCIPIHNGTYFITSTHAISWLLLINCMFRGSTRFTDIVYIFSSYFFISSPYSILYLYFLCSLLRFVSNSLKNMMMMMMTVFGLWVWFLLVVNTSASDCLERLVSEMTYYVSKGSLNSTHSLLVAVLL